MDLFLVAFLGGVIGAIVARMVNRGEETVKEKRLLWIAVYTHRYGNDVIPFVLPEGTVLTDEMVIAGLSDWEGDEREDEWLHIAGGYYLDKTGALEE